LKEPFSLTEKIILKKQDSWRIQGYSISCRQETAIIMKENRMQNTTTMAPRSRPLGVTIIAILTALQGAGLLILSAIGFVGFLVALSNAHTPLLTHVVIAGILGGVLVLIAVLLLLVAWGLWTLKRWAFWFTVVAQLLSLFSSISLLTQTGDASTTTTTSNIVVAVIILLYLFVDRNVRAAFDI
jgi:uncharacterized membrane protein (DUF2068 family)